MGVSKLDEVRQIMAKTGLSRAAAYQRMARLPRERWYDKPEPARHASHPWKRRILPVRGA